jgi:hypothetical protein
VTGNKKHALNVGADLGLAGASGVPATEASGAQAARPQVGERRSALLRQPVIPAPNACYATVGIVSSSVKAFRPAASIVAI